MYLYVTLFPINPIFVNMILDHIFYISNRRGWIMLDLEVISMILQVLFLVWKMLKAILDGGETQKQLAKCM